MMTNANDEIMGLIARGVKGEQFNEEETALIRRWACLSEENQMMADLLLHRPWRDQDRQNPADVPSLGVKRSLARQIKHNKIPKDKGTGNRWLLRSVILILLAAGVIVELRKSSQPTATIEYVRQKNGHVLPADSAVLLQLANGKVFELDSVANGSSLAASVGIMLVKIGDDSLRVEGPLSGLPGSWQSLTVGAHHRPLNLVFPDGSRMELEAASEYGWSTLRDKDHINQLRKGRVRVAIASNSQLPCAFGLPDGTSLNILGTSFEIDATNVREPKVFLVMGKVRVDGTAGSITMKPMDRVVVRNGVPAGGTSAMPPALCRWAGQPMVFHFKGARLGEVARAISEYYGLTIYKYGKIEGTGNLTMEINTGDGPEKNQKKINEFLDKPANIRISKDSLIVTGIR